MKEIVKIKKVHHAWFICAFLMLVLGALAGLILRIEFVFGFFLPLQNLLHAHSHILMLGWLNLLGLGLICDLLDFKHKQLKKLLYTEVVALLLMFIGFIYQSYGGVSIMGASMQMFANYFFTYLFFKNKPRESNIFIETSFLMNIVSTAAIFAIGPVSVVWGKASKEFSLAIAFFLHFQIEGWLLLLYFGILYRYFNLKPTRLEWWVCTTSLILRYALPIYNSFPHTIFYIINALGIVLQGFFILLLAVRLRKESLPLLVTMSVYALLAKAIFSLMILLPAWSRHALQNRDLVLFYLHWVFIGIISLGLLGILFNVKQIKLGKGIAFFLIGYWFTEFILGAHAIATYIPSFLLANKYLWLLIAALVMFVGVTAICIDFINQETRRAERIRKNSLK